MKKRTRCLAILSIKMIATAGNHILGNGFYRKDGPNRFAEYLSTQLESLGLPVKSPTLVLLTSDQEACRSGLVSLATVPQVVGPPSV